MHGHGRKEIHHPETMYGDSERHSTSLNALAWARQRVA